MQKNHIFHLKHMEDHGASITFHQKTLLRAYPVFMLALKVVTIKTYFLQFHI